MRALSWVLHWKMTRWPTNMVHLGDHASTEILEGAVPHGSARSIHVDGFPGWNVDEVLFSQLMKQLWEILGRNISGNSFLIPVSISILDFNPCGILHSFGSLCGSKNSPVASGHSPAIPRQEAILHLPQPHPIPEIFASRRTKFVPHVGTPKCLWFVVF